MARTLLLALVTTALCLGGGGCTSLPLDCSAERLSACEDCADRTANLAMEKCRATFDVEVARLEGQMDILSTVCGGARLVTKARP